jgi:hypothetical protein
MPSDPSAEAQRAGGSLGEGGLPLNVPHQSSTKKIPPSQNAFCRHKKTYTRSPQNLSDCAASRDNSRLIFACISA